MICSTFSHSFPELVPAGTRVPLQIGDKWNISAAQTVGGARPFCCIHIYIHIPFRPDSPEVTGTASIIRVSQSTLPPSASGSSSSSTSTSHSSSTTGAIPGRVVGGIIGAAVAIEVVAWFVVRYRRARSAPSTAYLSHRGQGGVMGSQCVTR